MPYLIESPKDSPFRFLPIQPWQWLRVLLRLLLFVVWTLFCVVMVIVTSVVLKNLTGRAFCLFHRGASFIFGLRIKMVGQPITDQTVMYLFNHVSYFDIMVIGSQVKGFFVAKSEVSSWPVLGHLSKIQQTIFIERNPRKAKLQVVQLGEHLRQGKNLIVFPEGTSTDGTLVAPVKSSLIQSAQAAGLKAVQPAAIVYNDLGNKPLSTDKRDTYTWYAEMPFFKHFLHAIAQRGVECTLVFGQALDIHETTDRKEIAEQCEIFIGKTLKAYNQ